MYIANKRLGRLDMKALVSSYWGVDNNDVCSGVVYRGGARPLLERV